MINPDIQNLIRDNFAKNGLVLDKIVVEKQVGLINRICDGLNHTSLPVEVQNLLKLYDTVIKNIPAEQLKMDMREGVNPNTAKNILEKSDLKSWVTNIRKFFFEQLFVVKNGVVDLNNELIALFGGEQALKKVYESINQNEFFIAIWDAFASEAITSYLLKRPKTINDEQIIISNCLNHIALDSKEFDYMVAQMPEMRSKVFLSNLLEVLESTKKKLMLKKSDIEQKVPIDEEVCGLVRKHIQDIDVLKKEINSDLNNPQKLDRNNCNVRYKQTADLFDGAIKLDNRFNNDSIKKILAEALMALRAKFEQFMSSASSLLFFNSDKEKRDSIKNKKPESAP